MKRPVREIMHSGVLTCRRETTMQQAAKQMVDNDVSALVVTDTAGNLVGLLSRTDLVKVRLQSKDKDFWRGLFVADIMTADVVTVHADDTLEVAGKMMMERHIHRVVVVEDNPDGTYKPLGILSVTDVVRDMAIE